MGAIPAMAKGTASVEPAGGAEKAAAAKPEAFEPETSGNLVQQGAGAVGSRHGREQVRRPPQGEAMHRAETRP